MTNLTNRFLCFSLLGAAAISPLGCGDNSFIVREDPARIVLGDDQLDFGDIPVGLGVTRRVLVVNAGTERLSVTAVTSSDPSITVLPTTFSLAQDESAPISVTFTPVAEEALLASVVVESNAENGAQTITIVGQGIANQVCGACDTPPEAFCASSDQLVFYNNTGSCVNDECRYDANLESCTDGCDVEILQCVGDSCSGGACDDVDAGSATTDAGTTSLDAGATSFDAGTTSFDAGTTSLDAGTVDAGAVPNATVFDTPGEYTFTVPANVTSLPVQMWGGGGAGGNQTGANGGGGAFVSGTLAVTPGETLTLWVASGGSQRGDGAGESAVMRGTTPLLVAGGGGGGGSDGNSGNSGIGGAGGAGGSLTGQAGTSLSNQIGTFCTSATGGTGGTQAAGGTGGTATGSASTVCQGVDGQRDSAGGATGVNGICNDTQGAAQWHNGGGQGNGGGGGGGAGYFGGGSAGFIWTYCAAGGGGGSSYADSAITDASLVGGSDQVQGNAAASNGRGAGGDVLGFGANGIVKFLLD